MIPLLAFALCAVGGTKEQVDVRLIAHPNKEHAEAAKLLMDQFSTFNAAKAQCFHASDRQRLLAVIEAGFGDFKEFNCSIHLASSSRPTPCLRSPARLQT